MSMTLLMTAHYGIYHYEKIFLNDYLPLQNVPLFFFFFVELRNASLETTEDKDDYLLCLFFFFKCLIGLLSKRTNGFQLRVV